MDDFERDLIAYLTERGYRVTRPRRATRTGQLSGKRLLSEHATHRAGSADLDRCRLCRFAAALAEHRTGHVDGSGARCFACVDEATAYSYASRLVTEPGPGYWTRAGQREAA